MVDVLFTLFVFALILIIGVFSEYLFQKFKIPDVLFLILFGFIIGKGGFNLVSLDSLQTVIPIFTVFALLFLLFEGAFNIDLISFVKGITRGLTIAIYNFLLSVTIITIICNLMFGFDLYISILMGFVLGGISSAFVIPVIQKEEIKKESFSILALESAITDVLCIVFTITMIEIIELNTLNVQFVTSKIATLFAVAGFFGIIGGFIWIVLVNKFFKENKSYMLTIGYLLLLYVFTEYLNGNGAIAALFFGLVLRNSKKLTSLISRKETNDVTTINERFFYSQISFFLKTFFFVYIGMLLNFTNSKAIFIGGIISLSLLFVRSTTSIFTSGLTIYDRKIISSITARGLAAVVLAQLVIEKGFDTNNIFASIPIIVVLFTIVSSSTRIFWVDKNTIDEEKTIQGSKDIQKKEEEKVIKKKEKKVKTKKIVTQKTKKK